MNATILYRTMNIKSLSLFSFLLIGLTLSAQESSSYEQNIKKEYINDVYIPINLDEAIEELNRLADKQAIAKFKEGDEELVSKKLHFGLGRWIIHNWNMYEGSRFSHYLRKEGISFPDDMARFVIVSFHRHLNNKDLDIENRIKIIKEKRKKEYEERMSKQKIIKEYTRKKN